MTGSLWMSPTRGNVRPRPSSRSGGLGRDPSQAIGWGARRSKPSMVSKRRTGQLEVQLKRGILVRPLRQNSVSTCRDALA